MFRPMDYYHMSFDQFWEHCKRYRNNYAELADIEYSINMATYRTSPAALFKQSLIADIPGYNCYATLESSFKAYLTRIEGDFTKTQTYIQGKASYDSHSRNLNDDWEEEWEDIQTYSTPEKQEKMRIMISRQSEEFCYQLAKSGVIFLAASKSAFTPKQYRALRYLYDNGKLL